MLAKRPAVKPLSPSLVPRSKAILNPKSRLSRAYLALLLPTHFPWKAMDNARGRCRHDNFRRSTIDRVRPWNDAVRSALGFPQNCRAPRTKAKWDLQPLGDGLLGRALPGGQNSPAPSVGKSAPLGELALGRSPDQRSGRPMDRSHLTRPNANTRPMRRA